MQENEHTIPELVDEVRAGKMSRRQFIKKLTAIGISTAGIAAIVAVASSSAAQSPTSMHGGDAPSMHHQLHDQHLAHQTQGNINALHHDYAYDAIVEDSMYAQPFVGRAAIMARKGTGMAAIPDLHIQVNNRIVHGNQLSVEWTATGTHSGDFPGLAATGRQFCISGVTVVVREGGKIVRESIYYDMAQVRQQLGSN